MIQVVKVFQLIQVVRMVGVIRVVGWSRWSSHPLVQVIHVVQVVFLAKGTTSRKLVFLISDRKKGTSKLTKMAILRKKGTLGNQWQSLINSPRNLYFYGYQHRQSDDTSDDKSTYKTSDRSSYKRGGKNLYKHCGKSCEEK